MTLFLAPAFCLFIAFGLAAALAWIQAQRWAKATFAGSVFSPSG